MHVSEVPAYPAELIHVVDEHFDVQHDIKRPLARVHGVEIKAAGKISWLRGAKLDLDTLAGKSSHRGYFLLVQTSIEGTG